MELRLMFNPASVAALADAIYKCFPGFKRETFLQRVFQNEWEDLALKQRMRRITLSFQGILPFDYQKALDILKRALPLLTEQSFEKMIFPDYVEVNGLNEYELSIEALELFTQHVSAEFAIRPFLNTYFDRTMSQMQKWSRHEHPAVRRLSSEGCRPRLPWGVRVSGLIEDPQPIIPILERLKTDDSESVRRSVANNLNDISKDHPAEVTSLAQSWLDSAPSERTAWVVRHGLRTLFKRGNEDALMLMGYDPDPAIVVHDLSVGSTRVAKGGAVQFSFRIESVSSHEQRLMIDFIIHYMKANGRPSPKVFKLKKITLAPFETVWVRKTVSFKTVTTRTLYSGAHSFQPQINGKLFASIAFDVVDGPAE